MKECCKKIAKEILDDFEKISKTAKGHYKGCSDLSPVIKTYHSMDLHSLKAKFLQEKVK